jgi:hypothetical protein
MYFIAFLLMTNTIKTNTKQRKTNGPDELWTELSTRGLEGEVWRVRVLTAVHLSPGSPAVCLTGIVPRPYDRLLCAVSTLYSELKPCPYQKSLLFVVLP